MLTMTITALGTLTIPAITPAVALVRRWLTGLLDGPHAAVGDDVLLLACEAVTNSIRHSDSGKNDQGAVTIAAFDVGDAVRVEVIDAGSATKVPRVLDEDSDAQTGRGLRLVEAVSAGRWGTYADDAGRTLWFEVPLAEPGTVEPSG